MRNETRAKHVAARVAKSLYWDGTGNYRKRIPEIQPIVLEVLNEGYKFPYDEVLKRIRVEQVV